MELEELFPEKPTFTLSATKKEYKLRPPNLEDISWAKNFYGSEQEIAKMFQGPDWPKCIRFVYRLLEDKSDFLASLEKQINDDGEEVEVKLTGPDKLLRAITGNMEGIRVIGALTKAMAIANPEVEKVIATEKKSLFSGKTSSTSSPRNTAGRSKK